MSLEKNVSFSYEEIKDLINYIDTNIFYLENCKNRFRILDLTGYCDSIDNGILKCIKYRNKFIEILDELEYSKFLSDNNSISLDLVDYLSAFLDT